MIILTGGAGFIGTNTLIKLNQLGIDDILVVDEINTSTKWQHLVGRSFREYVHKDNLWRWLDEHSKVSIGGVIHIGACTDTTETDFDKLINSNVHYSQRLWRLCTRMHIPLVYASSAATYGDGSQGFSDNSAKIRDLIPINAYGYSKHLFDLWVMRQENGPPHWAGLKYFNVYGPYEDCKGRMASVAHHALPQAINHGKIRLFRSHREDYKDGEQMRDFIFVDDAVDITLHFFMNDTPLGIYNVGTGLSQTFNHLAACIFEALSIQPEIEYFDMPKDLRSTYQYFTKADVAKLRSTGFSNNFTSLSDGMKAMLSQHPMLDKKGCSL